MSLYWPLQEADVVTNAPRLHAFVLGVGDYDHLGLGVPKPTTLLNGVAPLTTTVPAARRIARWLEREYKNPNCPLGSIELLLSPEEELARADNSKVVVDRATMALATAAFQRWYTRCDADEGSIAFFYFAGHGLSTISQFLLLADFGNPDLPDAWENCIDFTGMQSGMFKCKADAQFFFIDACRDSPVAALSQRNPHGKPLAAGATFQDRVDLSAAYFAASEGRQAYGRDGEETFFCQALIMCLNGVGARKPLPWHVNAATLSNALVSVIEVLGAALDLPLSCECRIQKPVPLHFPPSGAVVVSVSCDGEQANTEAIIKVTRGPTVLNSAAGESRPWMGTVEAGLTQIEVTFASYPPQLLEEDLSPPTFPWELPL